MIEAAAVKAETLLRASAGVRIIATSREPLNAEGEWVYRVMPLAVPGDNVGNPMDCSAVALFIARATELDFRTDQRNGAAIAAICQRLGGNPLAIELAAARAATLSVYDLGTLLDAHLQLLTCGRRTALPRHQTLRATLDWSYQLLSPSESTALRRLSVFQGEFGFDGARAVAAGVGLTASDVTKALFNLVAKSLLATEIDGGSMRYRLPETMRAYALEKLAESGEFDICARRHGEYSADQLNRAAAKWQTRPCTERTVDHPHPADFRSGTASPPLACNALPAAGVGRQGNAVSWLSGCGGSTTRRRAANAA